MAFLSVIYAYGDDILALQGHSDFGVMNDNRNFFLMHCRLYDGLYESSFSSNERKIKKNYRTWELGKCHHFHSCFKCFLNESSELLASFVNSTGGA